MTAASSNYLSTFLTGMVAFFTIAMRICAAEEAGQARRPEISQARLMSAVVLVEGEGVGGRRSSGTGFVVSLNDWAYVVTNQHVLFGLRNLRLKTFAGRTIQPKTFYVSPKHDLARIGFSLTDVEGLSVLQLSPAEPVFGQAIYVVGNSAGGGVATFLSGNVEGIADDRIEVSAKFVEGNSGSPIVDARGRVLGVATYATRTAAPSWLQEKTRFAKVRRFALRLEEATRFKKISWRQYQRRAARLQDYRAFLDDLFHLMAFDVEFMKTYALHTHGGKYHNRAWARHVYQLIHNYGLLEAVTRQAYPVEIKRSIEAVSTQFDYELRAVMKGLRGIECETAFMRNNARLTYEMSAAVRRQEARWKRRMMELCDAIDAQMQRRR